MRRRFAFVFLVTLLFVSIFPVSLFVPTVEAQGEGWLEGWQYRKSHVVNAAAGVGTNYQVKITVYYGSGTDSGGNVYVAGKCRTDFGDLRFTSLLIEYYRFSIPTTNHNDYGLSYPVTYVFSIPSGSSNLKAFKRTTQDWSQLTEKTSNDFFNGIECVRFDYNNDKAYVSVAFSADSDYFDIKITNQNDEIITFSFDEIAQYYDDRKAVVTATGDDWDGLTANYNGFMAACDAFQAKQVWFTVGISTQGIEENPSPNWTAIQGQLDEGFIEAASHSRTHLNVPYGDYDSEIGGSLNDIIGNLTLPSLYKKGATEYVWAWVEPYGVSDASVRAKLGQYKYLMARSANYYNYEFATWNATDGLYNRLGVSGDGDEHSLVELNGFFDNAYDSGLIYHLSVHPRNQNWAESDKIPQHLDYIKGKKDVWYVGLGALYAYHYVQERGVVTVTPTYSDTFEQVLLDYWIEKKVDGDYAVFWVEVADSLESANQTIYIYYGKADATTTSSGTNTFLQFDEFDNLNAWTIDTANGSDTATASGNVTFYHRANVYCHIEQINSNDNVEIRMKGRIAASTENTWALALVIWFNQYDYANIRANGLKLRFTYDKNGAVTSVDTTGNVIALNTWYWVRLRITGTTVYADYSSDGLSWTNLASTARAATWIIDGNSLTIIGHGNEENAENYPNPDWNNSYSSLGAAFYTYADQYICRKYVLTEPVHSTWGSEEKGEYVVIDQVFVSDERADVGSVQTVGFHAKWNNNGSDVVGGSIYVNGTEYVTNSTGWINVSAATRREEPDNFTIIALPDTQFYSASHPEIFDSQTQWVVNNAQDMNIVFVTHEGDIVDDYSSLSQWNNANNSMSKLDAGNVSYGVLLGNHDGSPLNLSNFNKFFNYSRFNGKSWYGGAYQNENANNFELFHGGQDDYLIFHFQYDPSDQVLTWANSTLQNYPNRRVIVTTHSYLNVDGSRTDIGNRIWQNFVAPHADQIFLVLCGHNHAETQRIDIINGHTVYQIMANYQDRTNGGNGWLRILELHPVEDKIYVRTYSPYLNNYETDADSQFTLDYDMTWAASSIVEKVTWIVTGVNCSGITIYTQTAQIPSIVWDRIKIIDEGITKGSVMLGETVTIWFKALYEYDNDIFDNTNGVLYVNGSQMSWSTTNNRWEYYYTPTTLGSKAFIVSGVSDSSYGLTVINDTVGAQTLNVWSSSFSVTSNSTITELAFNSTSKILSFTVSGISGTIGYTNVTIAKTLIADLSELKIYLDGNQIDYTTTSTEYTWLIHITYQHSTHKVVMVLSSLHANSSYTVSPEATAIFSGIIIVILAAILLVYKKVHKKHARRT